MLHFSLNTAGNASPTRGKQRAPTIRNPSRVLATRNEREPQGFVSGRENFSMLMTRERRPAIYDAGPETLRAESFVVTDRRAIYRHPGTGAETRLLTVAQRERNQPLTLDDALGLLSDRRAVLVINERSGRAAVRIPAPSLMRDDGEIEQRVRLLRPMESHSVSLKAMAESRWLETDRERFKAAWQAELAEVPEFTTSTIHVVAGLLLPIWKQLPNESTRVYRLQTDAGERIIGRKVSQAGSPTRFSQSSPRSNPRTRSRPCLKVAQFLTLPRASNFGASVSWACIRAAGARASSPPVHKRDRHGRLRQTAAKAARESRGRLVSAVTGLWPRERLAAPVAEIRDVQTSCACSGR
jgi:hypothetical protein